MSTLTLDRTMIANYMLAFLPDNFKYVNEYIRNNISINQNLQLITFKGKFLNITGEVDLKLSTDNQGLIVIDIDTISAGGISVIQLFRPLVASMIMKKTASLAQFFKLTKPDGNMRCILFPDTNNQPFFRTTSISMVEDGITITWDK